MFSRLWLINLVLAAGVIFFGLKAYGVWSEENKLPSKTGLIKKSLPRPEKKVTKLSVPPESAYEVVVSKNLFSVRRSEFKPQKQKETTKTKTLAGKRLMKLLELAHKQTSLYGVIMVVDKHKEALISEAPAGGQGRKGVRERGIKRVKEGDTVGRFQVKAIHKTSVILIAGGQEWRVSLFDKDKPKKRAQVKKDGGPIVIVGGSKMKSVLTDAKAVGKRPTPKPAVSKKETLPKAQNKKRTIPVPTDRSKTKKR